MKLQAPSIRQLRVGETVRKQLSQILIRGNMRKQELYDIAISVSEVRMTPDLRQAFVFIVPLGGQNTAQIVEALNNERKWLRGQLARVLKLKYMPELSFAADTRFDDDQRIDSLLRELSPSRPQREELR